MVAAARVRSVELYDEEPIRTGNLIGGLEKMHRLVNLTLAAEARSMSQCTTDTPFHCEEL